MLGTAICILALCSPSSGGVTQAGAQLPSMRPLWSFQPIRAYPVPKAPFAGKALNPVDHFIQERLASSGLKPSPAAGRRETIRRLTLDLTGLPPTPEEVRFFLADRSSGAYAKLVDRLLASTSYGERWARHWLDVVRFGESHGYEQNHIRPNAWRYRDYVIKALNADRPFDRFIAEQLAGDVLSKGDPDVEAATGFLVAGVHDTVGNSTEEGQRQQRADDLDDIVSTTGAALMGLTVGCAKCHEHKFDPIPQADYYRLAAVFAGVRHAERRVGERPVSDATKAKRQQWQASLDRDVRLLEGIEARGREEALRRRGVASVRPPVSARLNADEFPPVRARFVRFTILATLDGAEPCLDELRVFAPGSASNLALATAGAKVTVSSTLPGFAIHKAEHLIDGKPGNEWSWISAEPGKGHAIVELPAASQVSRVEWSRDNAEIPRYDDRVPSEYRIETSLDGIDWRTASTHEGRATEKTAVSAMDLDRALSTADLAERKRLQASIEVSRRELRESDPSVLAYAGVFNAPDDVYLLRRGDVMQREGKVRPAALSEIRSPSPDMGLAENAPEQERRLALANWLADARNPLTARVIVNRVWQHHFGRGLVPTPSDFGRGGEKPSHPKLLDWLAAEFRKPSAKGGMGWSLKELHRLIVTSATYRQSSASTREGMAKDAGNVLLWRMPLRRMEAEAVRDAVLQASGSLDRTMFGPSFDLFVYKVVNVAAYLPLEDYGPETWRRAVYSRPARGIRDDFMGTLDFPECSQRSPKRPSTTTALQALALLNGKFVEQQAGIMAKRIEREAGAEADQKARLAFEIALGRPPSATEAKESLALVRSEGLSALCRALMNANEFLYY